MPLTRSFKEFVKSRIEQDAKFRQALFQEAVQTLIEGDVETAKAVLRDYINATIRFPALAEATKMPPKSLMRMFGPKGNPTAANLFGVIVALQDKRRNPAMKDEYDFSKAERGKFFRRDAQLIPPVHLDPEVLSYLAARAEARGTSLNDPINELLKKDIERLEAEQ
jgi:hypothetical protein